jgi:hypothetical protein
MFLPKSLVGFGSPSDYFGRPKSHIWVDVEKCTLLLESVNLPRFIIFRPALFGSLINLRSAAQMLPHEKAPPGRIPYSKSPTLFFFPSLGIFMHRVFDIMGAWRKTDFLGEG